MKRKPLKRPSPWARHALLVLGGLIVGLMSLGAIFAPWIAPFDPEFINVNVLLQPPSTTHLMGTDALGRDVFSRILSAGASRCGWASWPWASQLPSDWSSALWQGTSDDSWMKSSCAAWT